MIRKTASLMIAAVLAGQYALAQNSETVSEQGDHLAVTIYNESLAMVREKRQIPLQAGINRIALRDVSANIMPETASIVASNGAPLQLLEQNFDFDLLTEASLLNKYVGKKVTAIRTNRATGEETREEATILAYNDSVVLQYADRIETRIAPDVRLSFADVPGNLRDRPTLLVDLNAAQEGEQEVDISYLTSGLSWKADYVATLANDEKSLNLAGWVTLTNQSGTTYNDAQLQLVAGDVNMAPPEYNRKGGVGYAVAPMALEAAPAMQQEELFEYHLYTLPRSTTIANNQNKQVALLSAANVPVEKEYRLQGADYWYYNSFENESPELGDKRKVDVFMQFDNKEESQLGLPLPKGIVRVYKNDRNDRAQFIGEDRVDHTAKNDTVRLKLGSAFDITGTWKHLDGKIIDGKISRKRTYEGSYSIELANAKQEEVVVKVVEPIPGSWEIVEESHAHNKASAYLAEWRVPVPAEGKTTLTYKVKITY